MNHRQRSVRVKISLFRVSLCIACTLVPFYLCSRALAEGSAAKPLLSVPIQVSIPTPPTIFRANGRRHLTYEIQMTNWSTDTWSLQRIDVRSNSAGALYGVEGKELGDLLRELGRKPEDKDGAAGELAPGKSVIAYMWIDLAEDEPAPGHLMHRFTVKLSGDETPRKLDGPTTVVWNRLTEIDSPLRGTNWLAVNGPSNVSHHRRSTVVLDGTPHIGQRYAIDWVKVGKDFKTFHGDPKDNRSYLCFGVDALAVGDGVVVEVKDGIPENVPDATPVVPITLETVAGNHIDLDLGGGVFAMYAHLQPGSLKVKLGDRVKRGQVLGLVGNTGNSTEPHLHFQLMDRNSPLASEGLPYALSEYMVTQRVTGTFPHPTASPLAAPESHRGEIPQEMQLVDFR